MSLAVDFVTETYPPEVNGVAMTVGKLVAGLRHRGHRVAVIRPAQAGETAAPPEEMLVRGLPLPRYPGLRLGLPSGQRLRARWQQKRPDLVHVVTEGPLGWSAVNAARSLGIPVTSGFHTNFDRYSVHYGLGWLRPAVAAYLRTLHRRSLATMVPTEALAADLAGEGIPGVRVVGRGVDVEQFSPAYRSPLLRSRWGVEKDALVCLYVGRLAPEKNLALVARCFSAISEGLPQARMVWVGDGPAAAELAASYPTHRFVGQKIGSELAAHYASADLFLFPSLSETYGNVVAEAMASGLPVLAYRSAAAAELIASGQNGVTVAPGDELAYRAAALALANNRLLRLELGEQARQTVKSYRWESIAERFEVVIREVLGRRD